MSGQWALALWVELAVVGLAVLALLLDAVARVPGRLIGSITAGGLAVVLLLTMVVPPSGGVLTYQADGFALFFKQLALAAGVLGVLGTMDWLARRTPGRQAEFHALITFSIAGMVLVPGARDWVVLLVGFELMSVPLAALSAWAKTDGGEPLAAEAGLKLFMTQAASTAVTVFGLALLVGMSGSTALSSARVATTPLAMAGLAMVLGGMAFKLGAAPFHMWVPDTYQGAPTPFVAFLSVAPKATGLAAYLLVIRAFASHDQRWGPIIAALAGVSMLVGNVLALPQSDVRRLLGYSGVAQMGYVLVAVGAGTEDGVSMALFFMGTYLFANVGLFLVLHVAAEAEGGHEVHHLTGLFRRSPVLGVSLMVFLLSLAGIPFVAGFWAKVFVFLAGWKAGLHGLVVAGLGLAVLGLFYYLRVGRAAFMEEPARPGGAVTIPAELGVALAVCVALVVGLGLWPQALVAPAQAAARSLGAPVVAAHR